MPVPPLAPLTVAVRVVPAHTVASTGDLVKSLATGSSTTIQLILFTGDVLQSVPVAVRRLSIRLVPVTAAKLGIVVLHPLQEVPLSVEYRYSSVIVPVPPLAPLTVAVRVVPAHTVASAGDLVKSLATGSSTTIQLILFMGDVLQSVPVAVRRLSIRAGPGYRCKTGYRRAPSAPGGPVVGCVPVFIGYRAGSPAGSAYRGRQGGACTYRGICRGFG